MLTKMTKRGTNLKRLTDKQRAFVFEYVTHFNGRRAAIDAGYSKKSADVIATRLLKDPLVSKLIGSLLQKNLEESKLTKERILKEVEYNAMRDAIDLCDENGIIQVDDLRKLPESIRRCIDGIKCKNVFDEDGKLVKQTLELKLTSKLSALELAMKHFGMLAPQEHKVAVSVIDWDRAYLKDSDIVDTVEGEIVKASEE